MDPEDKKLFVLAKATRLRVGTAQGAAVRDLDGRTYAAATLQLPSLEVSAVASVLAMASAGGAKGLEAAVVLGESGVAEQDLVILREFGGPGVPVHLGDPSGAPTGQLTT